MKPILALLLTASLFGLGWQRFGIEQLRREHGQLAASIERSAAAPQPMPSVAAVPGKNAHGEAALRTENGEIHQLRSQVGSLRRDAEPVLRLAAENERLARIVSQSTNQHPGPAQAPSGPLTLQTLVNAGLSTPESTLQTFFWSMREQDLDRYRECLAPPSLAQAQGRSEEQLLAMMEHMASILEIHIRARKVISDKEVKLGVELQTPGPERPVIAIGFHKIAAQWKLDIPM